MAKKRTSKNLNSIKQTHAKIEKTEPTTLDQIWGDEGLGKYGTMDIQSYENSLNEMNASDLQTHASTVGIIPIENRRMLTERLLREFSKHVSAYTKPVDDSSQQKEIDKEIKNILSEGR